MTEHTTNQSVGRLPVKDMLFYGFGAFANNLQAAASGGMMIVLNLAYGMNPALVGVVSAIPRLVDAISDPVMGYVSDHTRSRWGRRRPYIFGGILLAGLMFALMWQIPDQWTGERALFIYFLIFLIIFFLSYTVYATPWVALGYELTPDYHERSKLMGVQNFMGQIPFLVMAPWFLWFMELDVFGGMDKGASVLGVVVAVLCISAGLIPAIFLRERFGDLRTEDAVERVSWLSAIGQEVKKFLLGFLETVKNWDFLKLAGATFLVFNGFQLIGAFQSYVIIYYVYAGDRDAGSLLLGVFGMVSSVATFIVIALTTFLSTRIGKKNTFYLMIGISTIGYLLKWVCYSTEYPHLILLTAALIPFGLGALFTLMPSMIADVCDEDELVTRERREGMYGSIFWWVVKLGMSLALLLGGILLQVTGFDVELPSQSEQTLFLLRLFDVIVPALASALSILLVMWYSITEERARGIRQELEERRGVI